MRKVIFVGVALWAALSILPVPEGTGGAVAVIFFFWSAWVLSGVDFREMQKQTRIDHGIHD